MNLLQFRAGFIPALVPTSALFTLSDPIRLKVGMPPENVFTKNISLTFAWYHNLSQLSCSNVSGITYTRRGKCEIEINSAVYHDATGMYEARVSNLAFSEMMNLNGSNGVPQIVDVPHCSSIVLQSLEKYAVLRPITFHISESGEFSTCTMYIYSAILGPMRILYSYLDNALPPPSHTHTHTQFLKFILSNYIAAPCNLREEYSKICIYGLNNIPAPQKMLVCMQI